MRIIGVEFRLFYVNPRTGQHRKEIALVPCQIDLVADDPDLMSMNRGQLEITVHTSQGDTTLRGEWPFWVGDDTYGLKTTSK